MPNTTESEPKTIIDTSIFVAGLHSPNGGSAKIITACQIGKLKGAISSSTRDEIQRNLKKFKPGFLNEFDLLIAKHFQEIQPTTDLVDKFSAFVDPDDAHLLAACQIWQADYLVTLNRKHLLANQQAQSVIAAQITSPKELIVNLGL